MHYSQCTFVRKLDGNATSRYVAWIPSKFAVVGKTVSLQFGEKWIDGWEVISKGAAMDSETVERKSRDYLHSFSSIEPR